MDTTISSILFEWEGGSYYNDEYLAQAYTDLLLLLLDASEEERQDPRVIPFLEAGYQAYAREQDGFDSQAEVTRDMALAMVGGAERSLDGESQNTPPHPATPRGKRARSPSPEPEPEPEPEVQPELEVLESRERELKRFKTKFREEVMLIKGLGDALPSEQLMEGMFDSIVSRQRDAAGAQDDDRAIVEIRSTENVENPLWLSMRRTDQINGRVILDKLSRILNSNQAFMVNGQLKISYIHIPTPEAGGRRVNRVGNESMDQWLERKISSSTIYSPSNTQDNMCLARSVALAMARHGMHKQAFYKMKNPQSVVQKKEALHLCEIAGIDPNQPCGLDEVRKLQTVLPDYRLCVFTDKAGKECVFKGDYVQGKTNIYLLLHNEHFSVIFSPCQAFDYRFECKKCVVFFNRPGGHACEGSCWRCRGPKVHTDPVLRRCDRCGHSFAGEECFDNHSTLKLPYTDKTQCDTFRFCQACETSYNFQNTKHHVCGFVYCKYCKSNVKENHLCYMQGWEGREKRDKWHYISVYWDVEACQHLELEGHPGAFEHKANLIVSQAVCDTCFNVPQNEYFCPVCKTRQNIFYNLDDPNVNVMGQFIEYLRSVPAKTELLLIAHNSKAYDGVLALQEMIAQKLKPELVLQGAKILSMTVKTWTFIDSLSFLPMPLSAMPKSFGLTELKKGYFPFLFNEPKNYNYEGPLPPREMYCVSSMKSGAALEFHKWYDGQVKQGYVFNFRRELIEYCVSDVTILRQACQAFRQLFSQSAGFDPMFQCITLSSACMAAYRKNFLPPNTIGIVPPGGYHGRGKQSHKALRWMDYEEHKLGQKITTIYTDREVIVLGRPVDGYVEINKPDGGIEKRIYQFHGCYWHQCPIHYPANADSPINRYEKTVHLTSLFRRSGYTVVEKWECQFDKDILEDPEVIAYFEAHPTTRAPPLNLRNALCGGRTSALRWHHKADLSKGETIKMADVISEYPNANLRGMYPVGHPTIYLQGQTPMPPINTWNGIIKCTVLPPRDLFLPVLPYKCNGKLMFPLCRTCCETESKELCKHNDPADRQLTGEWCAPELQLAILEKGYTLITIHEIYQYPKTMQYNPETGEDGLLSGYVRRFMALKIQASGWPANCTSQDQKQAYMDEVQKHDGITIDPAKVEKNPALRTLAKLILNSFWGKFGEKTIRSKTVLLYSYADLIKLVTDPTKEITGFLDLSEECVQLCYKPLNDSEESLPTSSLLHAAFTTCFGRLQLYKYLDIVGDRALYHDTDSVAYISRPGEPDLPLGTHLGDLTDQVEEDYGAGSFITELVAGGPKNYGYKVAVGGDLQKVKFCVKVRGICINTSCDQLVTFENLKTMVLGDVEKMNVPIPHKIERLPKWKIVTRAGSKNWQAANNKRRRVDTARTVPHGYNAFEDADEEDQDLLEVMNLLGDA